MQPSWPTVGAPADLQREEINSPILSTPTITEVTQSPETSICGRFQLVQQIKCHTGATNAQRGAGVITEQHSTPIQPRC